MLEKIGPEVRTYAAIFKALVRARCVGCQREYRVRVAARRGLRLRDKPCPGCGARLRPFNWGGWIR